MSKEGVPPPYSETTEYPSNTPYPSLPPYASNTPSEGNTPPQPGPKPPVAPQAGPYPSLYPQPNPATQPGAPVIVQTSQYRDPFGIFKSSVTTTTSVVDGNTVVTVPLGPTSTLTTCPHCHEQIRTNVQIRSNTKTHLFAVLLCMFGCCCIPYCMDDCKGRNHSCPNCGAFLGTYQN